ncbi:TIGR04282 family arsenosugar biosynthesis glycosyltransferase [Pseudarthrobacter sp. P1]|uniref:TIGR04282 family arsenosugar biosynthesis glycosyltransferase n=1 Tax=Pseudarthrobacter sp. P1 TaxID=3418418 RepID=UPI003CEF8976
MNLTIAVIAKECLPGRVKTRLTPPLTPAQAACLAQTSLSQTLDTVRALPASRHLLVFDGAPHDGDAAGFEVWAQAGGGLDERLAAICALADGPLLIVGMDTPQLSRDQLAPLLADWSLPSPRCGAWLGPASDGGFWALGLHRPDGWLVRGVEMSTARTGADQLARLHGAGLAVGLLPTLRDVDHFADALAAATRCPGTPFARAVQALAAALASRPAGPAGGPPAGGSPVGGPPAGGLLTGPRPAARR